MEKRYVWILIVYILMQFSFAIGAPLLLLMGYHEEQIPGVWSTISFSTALIFILLLLRPDMKQRHLTEGRVSRSSAVWWSIGGVFLAYSSQIAAALIEMNVFGIEPGSENTELFVEIAKTTPIFMVVTGVIAPILEEIVFRFILFGALYKRMNFFFAALISSAIFAVIHFDFVHILIYTTMGLTFAFLYVKTKRILVPIVAHIAMNSFVMLVQVVFADKIVKLQQDLEKLQTSIGGL